MPENPEALAARRKSVSLIRSLSDSQTSSSPSRSLFVDELSSPEGGAGTRIWALLANAVEEKIKVTLTVGQESKKATHVEQRDKILLFTLPSLSLPTLPSTPASIELSAASSCATTIPITYLRSAPATASSKPVVPNSLPEEETGENNNEGEEMTVLKEDVLRQFATSGDAIHLVRTYAPLIGKRDADGNTVLHTAARSAQSYALKMFISCLEGERREEVLNQPNSRGQSALHIAVRAGDADSVHYLVAAGINVNMKDNHDNSVLHYIADAYNEDIYKEILEPGNSGDLDLTALNDEGHAPVHLAVRRLKLSLLEMLLEGGSPVDLPDSKNKTPLHHAIIMNDMELAEYLIQKGADASAEDADGNTPLLIANQVANYCVMGLLLDNGADAEAKNAKGVSLSDVADDTAKNIIGGERIDRFLLKDDTGAHVPLFGSSKEGADALPTQPAAGEDTSAESSRVQLAEEEDHSDADHGDDEPGPSSGRRRASTSTAYRAYDKDNITCLDYLTRLRLAKILDEASLWRDLAARLDCAHMCELIEICCGEPDSSPTMLLLDQFEQLSDASISRVRAALSEMSATEAVQLIEHRVHI